MGSEREAVFEQLGSDLVLGVAADRKRQSDLNVFLMTEYAYRPPFLSARQVLHWQVNPFLSRISLRSKYADCWSMPVM